MDVPFGRETYTRAVTNWPLVISLAVTTLYAFLPLIIDPSSYPPGLDPIRLQSSAELGEINNYLGHLPIRLIGVEVYYYATPLLMFLGIRYFFRDMGKWIPFFAWGLTLFLSSALYLNFVAGTWITQVNLFLWGLIALKLFSEVLESFEWKRATSLVVVALVATTFHHETAAYVTIAAGMMAGLKFIRSPRKNAYVIGLALPFAVGFLITSTVISGRAEWLVDVVSSDHGHRVVTVVNKDGERERFNASSPELAERMRKEMEKGGEAYVSTMNVEVWTNWFLSPIAIGPILLVTCFGTALYASGLRVSIPLHIQALALALPVLAIFTWTPLQVNGFRTGIHMVSFLMLLLAYAVAVIWKGRDSPEVRWPIVGVFGYYMLINLPNTLGTWIQSRA